MRRSFQFAVIVLLVSCVVEGQGIATESLDEGWVTHRVALSPTHERVVRGRFHNERGISELWIEDAKSGMLLFNLDGWGVIRGLAFRGDGKQFVATCDIGPLKVVNAETGRVVAELKGHSSWVHTVDFKGKCIVSAGRDKTLRCWDAERGDELWRKEALSVGSVAISPDGTQVASTDQTGRLYLWNAKNGKPIQTLNTGEKVWGFQTEYSRNGKYLVGGSRRIRVFETESGKTVRTVDVHKKNRASAAAISNDGSLLATAIPGLGVKVWRIADGKILHQLPTPRSIGALSFSNDGSLLCGAQYSGKCHVWNTKSGAAMVAAEARNPWVDTETDCRQMLLSIAFFDSWRGVAVGGDQELGNSLLAISVDDGQSWSELEIDATGRLYDIDILDNRTAVAVGYNGVVIKTEDRGETWKQIETPAKHWLAGVDFVDSQTGFIVGGSSKHPVLWKSIDSGEHWEPIHENLPPSSRNFSLRDVKFLSAERGFVVGTDGRLFATEDGGNRWQPLESGTSAWLRAIHLGDGFIHIAGKGVLLRSVDDGKRWERLPIPERRKLVDVAFATKNCGWITNFDGEVLETRDAGRTWKVVYRHPTATTGIHLNLERLLIATDNGYVLRQRR